MPPIVKLDIQDGHDAEVTKDGWRATRIAFIKGVEGTGSQKIYNAALATSGMPAINDPHPSLPNTYLSLIRPKKIDGDIVILELLYKAYDLVLDSEYELSGVVIQENTNLDKNGNPIYLGYTYPEDYQHDPTYRNFVDVQGIVFSKMIAVASLRITKQSGMGLSSIQAKRREYLGTVNLGSWSENPLDPAGCWMCTEVRARRANLDYWYITFGFQYRPPFLYNGVQYPGWAKQLVYIDPNTGKPPPPSTWTEYTFRIEMPYEYKNFDSLTGII